QSTAIVYTLTLHDALPISDPQGYKDLIEDLGKDKVIGIYLSPDESQRKLRGLVRGDDQKEFNRRIKADEEDFAGLEEKVDLIIRSEEHTSELQSRFDLVCR